MGIIILENRSDMIKDALAIMAVILFVLSTVMFLFDVEKAIFLLGVAIYIQISQLRKSDDV